MRTAALVAIGLYLAVGVLHLVLSRAWRAAELAYRQARGMGECHCCQPTPLSEKAFVWIGASIFTVLVWPVDIRTR